MAPYYGYGYMYPYLPPPVYYRPGAILSCLSTVRTGLGPGYYDAYSNWIFGYYRPSARTTAIEGRVGFHRDRLETFGPHASRVKDTENLDYSLFDSVGHDVTLSMQRPRYAPSLHALVRYSL